MLSALKIGSKSAKSVRVSPPSLPSLQQIHTDIETADDDDVVFTLAAADLVAATAGRPQQLDNRRIQIYGSEVDSAAATAASCTIVDSSASVGTSVYRKVETFVEQVLRMTNTSAKLIEDSERLESLLSELEDSVTAVRRDAGGDGSNF